jgi:hypothetical protein
MEDYVEVKYRNIYIRVVVDRRNPAKALLGPEDNK